MVLMTENDILYSLAMLMSIAFCFGAGGIQRSGSNLSRGVNKI